MDPVWLFLLAIAGIFLVGAIGEISFQRTNIPDVIWLIAAGIILGPIAGWVTRADLRSIAPYFAAITLVVVLFEGGSALKLGGLSQVAPRSSILGLLAFGFSVLFVTLISVAAAFVGIFPDEWTWTHGVMLGMILGGSSSIVIMPAMAQARLKPKLANLVNLESALTDAFCVVGTVAVVDILRGSATGHPAVTLAKSFGIGLGVGMVAGLIWILFLKVLRSKEHAYPVTLSALLILYVLIDNWGGSAALGILTVAVLLGNAPSLGKMIGLAEPVALDEDVRGFHSQMAFIIKSLFFVFIGASLGPPWGMLIFGLLLGGVLLVARVPSVVLATVGAGFDKNERNMITVCMPRGMAAGVLATIPMVKGVPGTQELPVVVFAAVLSTILVFAVGFPIVKRKLPTADIAEGERASIPLPAGAAMPSQPPAAAVAPSTAPAVTQPDSLEPPPTPAEATPPDGGPQNDE